MTSPFGRPGGAHDDDETRPWTPPPSAVPPSAPPSGPPPPAGWRPAGSPQPPSYWPPPGDVPPARPPGLSSGGPPTDRGPRTPLVLAALALVAIVGLGAYLAFAGQRPGDPRPSATSGAVASGSPDAPGASADPSGQPPPPPPPSGSGDPATASLAPDLDAAIAEITDQVPAIRGLEPLHEVPSEIISEEELARTIRTEFLAENPRERIAAEEALMKRMGYLEPDADLVDLALELYTSQILAFYRPDTGRFYLVDRDESEELTVLDRITVAHEYTHALQDQHFDLEAVQPDDPAESDRALARLALIEGDATALMFAWATQHFDLREVLELMAAGASPADQQLLERMPPILRRQIEFPYLDGFLFVQGVQADGGWEAVDALYAEPPATTEQILHPRAYEDGEAAVEVSLPDAETLGEGWALATEATLGEMQTQVWVADGEVADLPAAGLLPLQPGADAAAGWAGDRIGSYDGPDGSWAVLWNTAWDTSTDAAEFAAAAEEALADLPGANAVREVGCGAPNGTPAVTIVIARDEATLASLPEACPGA